MKEKQITKQIITTIHKSYACAHVRKRLSTGSSGTTGWPDITGHICGIHINIEVKQPGFKPRKLQISRIRKLNKANSVAIWADSVDICMRKLKYRLAAWRPPKF